MASFDYETSTILDAPIQQAWDYLTTHDDWRRPFIASVTQVSGDGLAVGAQYENRMGGMKMTITNEITVVDPPRQLQWRQVNDDTPLVTTQGNYILESLDAGTTRFTLRNSYFTRIPGVALILPRLMDAFVARRLLRQLAEGVHHSRT